MDPQTVLFILDEDFAGDLYSLSRSQHVWICASAATREKIEKVWEADNRKHNARFGVTSFNIRIDKIKTFYSLLATIDEHHSGDVDLQPWHEITVLGLEKSDVDSLRVSSEVRCNCEILPGSKEKCFVIRRSAS